ncbi:hypothetical protein DGMP_26710 [Desulfomarina profundi]|uniref:RiboL-PSP-HEPN domain-containing protein n=1 Tax=Desulfomarina profundi TaxID=2772557 RepID=A0A8D5FIH1_9BACT|nr:hypothetical protein [Desulfomarina profundi]BCL61978.1 hypothetical protein DGMP_26710 [Desulfomarina profundi]
MTRLAININGTLAKSNLNELKVILDHDFVVSNISTNDEWNLIISQALFKSVYCRSVDIFQDSLYKFVKDILGKLDLNDSKLVYGISGKRLKSFLATSNPKQNIEEYLFSTLGYRLKQLRDYAINLQMPLTQEVETIIQTRNIIVHKNGRADEKLLKLYKNTKNDLIVPKIIQNTVQLDRSVTYKSIELLSDTICGIENVLNAKYDIEWTYIEKKFIGNPLEFFDWIQKPQE